MRLDKFLCETKSISRTEAKQLLKKGVVLVNGKKEVSGDLKIAETTDEITLNGELLSYAQFHYYLLNKPAGVISATKDNFQTTVLDLLKGETGKDLAPVGRLDKDTEGLLLITDDGALAHALLAPKKHVDKTYLVKLKEPITKEAIAQLEKGVDIGEEQLTLPAKVEEKTECEILLTIREGKFHQVKRMLLAVSNEVTYLKRLQMGPFVLPKELPLGEYLTIPISEIEKMKQELGL